MHGSHASRIDCILIYEHQIRWRQMHPLVHNRFERIQGVIGLIHRPLNISVLNRYVAPVASPCPQPIDRYKLRHEFLGQTPLWLEFDAAAQSLIAQYTSNLVHSHSGSTMVLSRILEFKLRQFALVISHRMMQKYTIPTFLDYFRCWIFLTKFQVLHTRIRQYNRIVGIDLRRS